MPIALFCGNCNAKLNAPDAAAGKKVKCPKCATILQIPLPEPEPSFEVVDDEPAPRPITKAKPKPVVLDEGDEDEPPPRKKQTTKKPAVVLDEERPRPTTGKKGKSKSKKVAGGNLPLLIGGGVVALAVVGVLVWLLFLREPSVTKGPDGGNNPNGSGVPVGWTEFKNRDFSVWFRNPSGQVRVQGVRSGTSYGAETFNPNGAQKVAVFELSGPFAAAADSNPASLLEGILIPEALGGKGIPTANTDATLDGKPARAASVQQDQRTVFIRAAIDGKRAFVLLAGADGIADPNHEQVKTFFDNFKILAGAPNPGTGQPPTAGPTLVATDLSKYGVPITMDLPAGTNVRKVGEGDDATVEIDYSPKFRFLIPFRSKESLFDWVRLHQRTVSSFTVITQLADRCYWESNGQGVRSCGMAKSFLADQKGYLLRSQASGVTRAESDAAWECMKSIRATLK